MKIREKHRNVIVIIWFMRRVKRSRNCHAIIWDRPFVYIVQTACIYLLFNKYQNNLTSDKLLHIGQVGNQKLVEYAHCWSDVLTKLTFKISSVALYSLHKIYHNAVYENAYTRLYIVTVKGDLYVVSFSVNLRDQIVAKW